VAKILAVDDSASMRQMVSFTLAADGHDVVDAIDGKQAFEIAQTESFDLVLTDVNMPEMNGLELTQKLRGLEQYRFTPILVLTTESSVEKKKEGRSAGATGWIVKPFNPEQLLATIKKVLD